MINETHPKIDMISKTLKNLSKDCNSLTNFVDIAFDFHSEGISITPLQKKNEIYSLLEILSQNELKNILEIGTANGGTLFLLCKIASKNANIISIDLPDGPFGGKMYPNWKIPFYETFASNSQKIHLLRKDSHQEQTKTTCKEILKDDLLDFLLIDGDHQYEGVKKDFEMYKPLVREGGIIAFHDVSNGPIENVGGVGKFWKEIKEKYNGIEIVDNSNDEGYGIGLILISKEKNTSKHQEILKIIYKNQKKIIIELQNRLKNTRLDFIQHPLSMLLTLYYERPDLQQAFPEVSDGKFQNMVNWAKEVNSGKQKEEVISRETLSKFSDWYKKYSTINYKEIEEKNEFKNLLNQTNRKNDSLLREKSNLIKSNEQLEQAKSNLIKSNEQLEQAKSNLIKSNEQLEQKNSNLVESNEQLEQAKSNLIKSNEQLEQAKSNLIKSNEQLEQAKSNLIKSNEQLNSKLIELDNIIVQNQKTINSISFDVAQYQKELELIKSSFGFKTIRFFGSKIDKLSNQKKILKDVEATISASKVTIEQEGLNSFAHHAKEKIKRRELLLHSQSFDSKSLKPSQKISNKSFKFINEAQNISPKFSASVIIPTNSNETQVKHLVENINSQLGFKNLKIVLVNSGNDPLQNLTKFTNLTILTIKPEEFSHGRVRNLGMKQSEGDYVFFISDDALPTSKHLFYDMCEIFSKDEKIAATFVRQIPKSDSDLMAIFSLKEYYQSLDLSEDRIVYTDNFSNLDPIQKRTTSQIDDVCSCYKLDILAKYQFGKVKYAEDLEIGSRLIQDGYKISQLFSKGIIHSHKRPALYYLKRHFVENQILSEILSYQKFDYKRQGISSFQDLVNHFWSLYSSINFSIEHLKENKILDISQIFGLLKKELSQNYSINANSKSSDESLEPLFQKFPKPTSTPKNHFLLDDYQNSLNHFQTFLKNTYPNISGMEIDFYDTLYKLFAVIIGDRLGSFSMEFKDISDKNLERIILTLEGGV